VSVVYGFYCLDGVDLGYDDARSQPGGAHCHSAPAPAVSGDDDHLAGHLKVGRVQKGVPCGLPGAVPVVEEVLHFGVVDGHCRERQLTGFMTGVQTVYSGGRFLCGADQAAAELTRRAVKQLGKVSAVVEYQMRGA
jgi:hypothetical protein